MRYTYLVELHQIPESGTAWIRSQYIFLFLENMGVPSQLQLQKLLIFYSLSTAPEWYR